jgi:hypothetical protein
MTSKTGSMGNSGNDLAKSGKRIRAQVCPVCGGTILAPQSLELHLGQHGPKAKTT